MIDLQGMAKRIGAARVEAYRKMDSPKLPSPYVVFSAFYGDGREAHVAVQSDATLAANLEAAALAEQSLTPIE